MGVTGRVGKGVGRFDDNADPLSAEVFNADRSSPSLSGMMVASIEEARVRLSQNQHYKSNVYLSCSQQPARLEDLELP